MVSLCQTATHVRQNGQVAETILRPKRRIVQSAEDVVEVAVWPSFYSFLCAFSYFCEIIDNSSHTAETVAPRERREA